ncbi:hypothetical protein GCM10017782_27870 [Deinococcus ficus]|nr:hypothetical protein GCM10017782_27870 [Deinococcus ficus]
MCRAPVLLPRHDATAKHPRVTQAAPGAQGRGRSRARDAALPREPGEDCAVDDALTLP